MSSNGSASEEKVSVTVVLMRLVNWSGYCITILVSGLCSCSTVLSPPMKLKRICHQSFMCMLLTATQLPNIALMLPLLILLLFYSMSHISSLILSYTQQSGRSKTTSDNITCCHTWCNPTDKCLHPDCALVVASTAKNVLGCCSPPCWEATMGPGVCYRGSAMGCSEQGQLSQSRRSMSSSWCRRGMSLSWCRRMMMTHVSPYCCPPSQVHILMSRTWVLQVGGVV